MRSIEHAHESYLLYGIEKSTRGHHDLSKGSARETPLEAECIASKTNTVDFLKSFY